MSATVSLDTVLRFPTPTDEIINLRIVGMTIDVQNGETLNLQLSAQLGHEIYQKIESEHLFNLEIGEVEMNARNDFDDDLDINFDIKIDPDLLFLIPSEADTEEAAITYFVEQNHENVHNPLYATGNWFALHVTQKQTLPDDLEGQLKVGYATKWA
ncbi:hypothetical protein PN441_07570 [Spirulina major CS-329]|uniref:hypothetical protein n=1 Tax=Spirulina TaxID=1154 RepID=UPI00232F7C0A|nr:MULTISPECIES: hypothetical protein [Spirulina]MDB9494820.1 hypothetical protein [Spirulina subsalsa CS-330]MDB9502927.1 hypothetical protein [Spirulina major CS-329]